MAARRDRAGPKRASGTSGGRRAVRADAAESQGTSRAATELRLGGG